MNRVVKREPRVFYPKTQNAWRNWLEKNHQTQDAVWLAMYRKSSGKPTITWSEAVDVALCFGWIDSKKVRIDEERSHQFFSKRKPKSPWSKINKGKVKTLIEQGLMSKAGLDAIERARKNGSWTLFDEAEELIIPADLEQAFKKHKGSKRYYLSLSRSVRKMMLQWIVLARRPETRQKRIKEIAEHAARKEKPSRIR